MRTLTFRGPEHVAEHSGSGSGTGRSYGLHEASGSVFERTGKGGALRRRIVPGDNVKAPGHLSGGERWDRRSNSGIAADVLLPIGLGRAGAWLFIGNHGVGVIENGRIGLKPIGRGGGGNLNEVLIAGSKIDGQARGRIRPAGIGGKNGTIGGGEGFQRGDVGIW